MGNQELTRYYDHLSMNVIHLNWAHKLQQSFGEHARKCGVALKQNMQNNQTTVSCRYL